MGRDRGWGAWTSTVTGEARWSHPPLASHTSEAARARVRGDDAWRGWCGKLALMAYVADMAAADSQLAGSRCSVGDGAALRRLDSRTRRGAGNGDRGQRARHELLATGETARRRSASGTQELTAQKALIAQIACDRLSDPEISIGLFISTPHGAVPPGEGC